MTNKRRHMSRHKALQEQATKQLTVSSALGNPSLIELNDPTTAHKTVAVNSANCDKRQQPRAGGCIRKTFSEQAFAKAEQGVPIRDSEFLKRTSFSGRSLQDTSRDMRFPSVEACTEERCDEQIKEKNQRKGWTSDQEVALKSAYFEVRASANFWFEVSKKVPGKTAKDCFDRVYSAHPTPPATQPRSKRISRESPMRTITFASPKSSFCCNSRFGGGKRGLLKAHKTVRHILRKQKVADGTYEADVFSLVEGMDCESPTTRSAKSCRDVKGDNEVSQYGSSMHETRFHHGCTTSESQVSVLSPEVLKAEQDPSRLDRFLDVLHLRRVPKKSASLRHTRQGPKSLSPNRSCSPQCVAGAREAILTGVKEVLSTSLQQECIEEEGTSVLSEHTEDEESSF